MAIRSAKIPMDSSERPGVSGAIYNNDAHKDPIRNNVANCEPSAPISAELAWGLRLQRDSVTDSALVSEAQGLSVGSLMMMFNAVVRPPAVFASSIRRVSSPRWSHSAQVHFDSPR